MGRLILEDGEPKPAPGELRLVQAFANTCNLYNGVEHFTDPDSLTRWFERVGLLGDLPDVGENDLKIALELREALRALLAGHNGSGLDRDAVRRLDQLASVLPVRVGFDEAGKARVFRPASDIEGALGILLGVVLCTEASGKWERLKACANPGCRWVFYDASRNRAGSWCRMSTCGNQAKSRAHRERLRRSKESGDN